MSNRFFVRLIARLFFNLNGKRQGEGGTLALADGNNTIG